MRRIAALVLCLLLCGCAAGPDREPPPEEKQPTISGTLPANGGAVARIGEAVYTLRYHGDSFEPGGLWGDYAAKPGALNELVRYEGEEETVLTSGPWFGPLWALGDRLVAERVTEDGTGLVCLSRSGEELWTCEGGNLSVKAADPKRGLLVCADDWTVFSLDGEGKRTDLGQSVRYLVYEDGVLYLQDYAQHEEAVLLRLTLDGQPTELARVTVEYGGNSGPVITQVEVAGDTVYFLYGSYDGTANVFQGGWLAAAKLDDSGCRVLAEVPYDKLFLREREGNVTLLYPSADQLVWDGETALELDPETGEVTETGSAAWFQPVGVPFDDGDAIRVVRDRSGGTITLAENIQFPTVDCDGEEPGPWREIRDIAVADGWLWYTLEVGRYSEEYSIGWRDGYERVVTQVCRMPLEGGGAEVLYEY